MKFTIVATTALTLLSTFASASTATKDDSDAVIRDLMSKVDFLSVEHAALSAEVASLKYPLSPKATKVLQGNTDVRRGLRQDEAVDVDPQDYEPQSLKYIVIGIIETLQSLKDNFEDVHNCVDYNSDHDLCTIGGDTIGRVEVKSENSLTLSSKGRIDVDAATNIEMYADLNDSDDVNGFAFLGTSSDSAYFRARGNTATGSASAKVFAIGRIDIDITNQGNNIEVDCGSGISNLCALV